MSLPKHNIIRLFFTSLFSSFFFFFLILNFKFLIPKASAADWTWGSDGNGNFVVKDRTTGIVKFQLDANGVVTTSRLSASNLSSGSFGSNTGGGNYSFPGNVGIGTTGPTQALDIVGQIKASSTVTAPTFSGALSGTATTATTATNLSGGTVSATTGTFSGNVGIGTTGPTQALDVVGQIKASSTVTAPTFSGALSGNASTATTATTATNQSGGTVSATTGAFSGCDSMWGGWCRAINLSHASHAAIAYPAGGLMFGMHSNTNFYWANTTAGTYPMTLSNTGGLTITGALSVGGNSNTCQLVSYTGGSGTTSCPAGYYTYSGVGLSSGQLLCCKVSNPI